MQINMLHWQLDLILTAFLFSNCRIINSILNMMQLRVSSKKQAKIKLAFQGCAGSGKLTQPYFLPMGCVEIGVKLQL